MKEKNNQNKKDKDKEKECPLCEVSEETIRKLKEKEKSKEKSNEERKPEIKTKQKSSWKSKIWLLIFILVLGGFVFYQFSRQQYPAQEQSENKAGGILDIFPKTLEVGEFAPDFLSEDVYGNKIALSDFKEKKPVLVVFWATWCGYCAKELDDLKNFTQAHQNEIQVVAVDSGEPREALKNYIQEKDINFLILLDEDRKIWNQYLVRGTPSHFLISSSGKIVSLRPGLASREDLEIMMTMLTELW